MVKWKPRRFAFPVHVKWANVTLCGQMPHCVGKYYIDVGKYHAMWIISHYVGSPENISQVRSHWGANNAVADAARGHQPPFFSAPFPVSFEVFA